MNKKINIKYLYSLVVVLIIVGIIKLFIFSVTEDDERHQKDFNQFYKVFALNIPANLNFSGEKVPIANFDTREKIDRELIISTYWQSQTLLLFKRANRWFPVIEPILEQQNIPNDFKYVALIESGLSNVVSPAGAVGYWQIIEATANEYGLEVNYEVDERYHVEKATLVACKYLKEAYKKFNSWTLAAASYNMGINGVERQIAKQKVNNYYDLLLNEETARYIFRILAIKEVITHPDKYGYYFRKKDLYPPIPTYQVEMDTSINDLAEFAIQNGINYKILKIFNPWLRQSFLTNKDKKTYSIKIPKEGYSHLFQDELMALDEQKLQDSLASFSDTLITEPIDSVLEGKPKDKSH